MKINRCNRFLSFLRRFFTASAIVVNFFGMAQAVQQSWKSDAASTDWATGTNWVSGTAPANSITTDTALFNQTSYVSQPNAGTRSITGITIGDGTTATAPLTISGTQLTIGASGIDKKAGSGTATISSPVTLGAAQTWQNASANDLTISGAVTAAANLLTVNGATNTAISGAIGGTGGLTKLGAGTLTLSGTGSGNTGVFNVKAGTLTVSGGTITAANQIKVGDTGGTGTPVFNLTGGTVTATVNGNSLYIGGTTSFPGSVTVSGGTFNSSTAGALVVVGDNAVASYSQTAGTVNTGSTGGLYIANNANSTGSTVAISGGTFNAPGTSALGVRGSYTFTVSGTAAVNMGYLQLGHSGGTTNNPTGRVVNLNGGTLKISNQINYANGTATVNLNGGILQANSTNASFWNNNANVTATIGASGITIDTQAFNDTISQVLGGTGGLTKTGSGSLILSGANTYTGTTTVAAGSLSIPETSLTSGLSAANGTTLIVSGTSGALIGTPSPIANLTLGSTPGAGGATLSFNNFVSNTGQQLIDTTNFTANGASQGVTVNLAGAFTGTGDYPLVTFANPTIGGDGFAALKLGTLPRSVTANLLEDSQILWLQVTGFNPLKWKGDVVGGLWDINNTANWQGIDTKYLEGDIVVFDETATGTTNVALNSTVIPASVTVANTDYSITGTGTIAGTGPLIKNGSGTLTLSTNNTFTGLASINGGTIKVGHANALGSTAIGTVVASGSALDLNGTAMAAEPLTLNGTGISSGGALINSSATAASTAAPITLGSASSIGGSANMTLSGDITGTTGLTKVGAGVTTFSSRKSYTGSTVVNGGILDLTGGGGTGGTIRGTVTVNTGGSLQLSTGDATGYSLGTDRLTAINVIGGNMNVNTTSNQTLGAAAFTMQGGTLTGVPGSNLDFFTENNGDPLIRSSFSTLASATTSVVSGVKLNMRQNDGVIFNIADGAAAIDLDVQSNISSSTFTNNQLVKNGTGTMRLSGLSTYTYPTVVNAGSLIVPAVQSSPSFDAADNTGLVITGTPGSSFSVTSLTMGDGTAASLGILNFGEQTLPANAPVKASGTLDFWGALALNVNGSFTTAGTYPLISYPVGGYVAGSLDDVTLTLPPNVSGSLLDNPTNKTVDLVLSAVDTLIWKGNVAGGVWDVNSTANWFANASAPDGKYQENMVVRLDDTATGTTSIALNSAITPSGVVVNNPTKNYTVSGTGSIGGTTSLTKSGAATLTLATANTYTGPTTVNAGTLQLGDGTNDGSVAGNIINNGSGLILNNVGAITLPGAISGTAGITKTGAGTATLTASATYGGATTVTGGSLVLGNGVLTTTIPGASTVTVGAGATIAWNNNTGATNQVIANNISGAGSLLLQGYNATNALQVGVYELTGNNSALSGGITLNRSLAWNNNTPTKLGSGEIVIQDRGTIAFNGSTFANNINVQNGAGWHHNVGGDVVIGAIRLEGTNTLGGNIVLNQNTGVALGDNTGANSTIGGWGQGNHTLTGVISGTGEFSMSRYSAWNGGTTQFLNFNLLGTSSNTYTGKTVVDGQGANVSLRLGKTGGAVAIQGGTTVQFGSGTGGQANLRMLGNNQLGTNNGGVLVNFVNASNQWGRFELQGTTQSVAGLNCGTVATQGGGIIQNRAISDSTSIWGDATLTLTGSGSYLFNGYIRNSDNSYNEPNNRIALVKNGSGTQTLVGTVIDYAGQTTVNTGNLTFRDMDDSHTTGIAIASGSTLEVNTTARNFAFNSASNALITGTGNFVKTGTMTLTTGGANGKAKWAMTGGLIDIQAGTFVNDYADQATTWTSNKASLNIATGATVSTIGGNLMFVDALTGGGTLQNINSWGIGVITVGVNGGSGDFTGIAKDNGGVLAITKVGAGTQTLSGVNTYTGATTISSGTLALGATGSIGNSGTVNIASGALFDVSATAGFTLGTGKTIIGGRSSGSGNDLVGNLYSTGTINVAGTTTAGTFTISGELGLDGGANLALDLSPSAASGNDKIAVAGNLDLTGSNTVTPLFSSTPDTANPYTIMTYGGTLTGDQTNLTSGLTNSRYALSFDTSTANVVKMSVTGTGMSLVWSGAAAEVWTAADDLELNWNAGADYFKNLDAVTFNDTNATGTVTLNTTVSPSSVTVGTVDAGVTPYTISGTGSIAGGGMLTKTGTALLTLSTANTFSGGTLISQGEIRSTNGSSMGTGTVTLNDGTTAANNTGFLAAAAQTINNNVVVANSGTGTVTLGSVAGQAGLVNYNGAFTLNKAATINGSSDRTTFNGKISGAGNITIAGSSGHRVTFANSANDFTGSLAINSGLIYQSDSPTALLPTTDIDNAGSYRLNGGGTHAVDSITGAGAINIAAGGATTLSIGNNNGASNISGVISTAISLVKNGTQPLTLSAANTYTGTTRLNAGTTSLGNASALGGSTLVWDNLGGALSIDSAVTSLTLGALQGAQDFTMQNASATPLPLTVGGNNASTLYTGALLGGTTFTKTGTGTMILGGTTANTYTGLTSVNQGQLGLSKVGAYGITGNITGNNVNSPEIYTTQDNQFAPGCVMRFDGTTGDHLRFELLGTTQTLAGIDNSTGTTRGVIQTREQAAGLPTGNLSNLILDVPNAAAYSFNGYLRDSGGVITLTKNGLGMQTLAGANITHTGLTTINAGTLSFDAASVGRGSVVINNGGTLRSNAGNAIDGIPAAQTITINAGGLMTDSLGADNIYAALVMNGGNLGATVAGHTQYGNWVLNNNLTVTGTQKSVISADLRCSGNSDRTFTVNPTGDPSGIDLDITGKIGHINGSQWSYMTKAGAGTLRFNNPAMNSDIGRITVNAGKVIFKDYMAGMGDGGLILNAGGTADADMGIGVDYTYASKLGGTAASTGVFNKIGAGNLTISGTGGTFAGNINVIDGKLIGKAAGAFGASNNTRTITVSAGKTLEFHASNVFGNHGTTAAPIVVQPGGVITNADPAATGKINNGLGALTLNSATLTATVGNGISVIDDVLPDDRPGEGYGAWGLNGTVTSTGISSINVGAVTGMGGRVLLGNQAAGTTMNVVDGTLTVSAPLQASDPGIGGLTKTGTGKLVLSAANIYSAATTINGGTLELTGSLLAASGVTNPSNITVGSGATLMGTGTATGTLAANGIVAPGSSIGTLAVGATTFGATGSLNAEINSSSLTADKLAVTGALSIEAGAELNVTDLGSGTPATAKLVLISYTGTWDGGTFDGLADDSTLLVNGNTYTIDYNASDAGTNAVVLRIGSADPFDAWASGFGLTGGDALKGADPDKDGVNNLLEFATNADPTSGSSGPRVYPLMHVIGADNALTYTMAVRKFAVFAPDGSKQTATQDMVVYTVEASNDLATWTVVPVTEVTGTDKTNVQTALGTKLTTPPIGADWEWRTFRTDAGSATDPSDHIRLKVTEAP